MSDVQPTPDAPSELAYDPSKPPAIRILTQYVKDLSFENPHAPQSLIGEVPPKIELEVELNAARHDVAQFQLEMKLTVHAAREEQTAFHVELVYGGVFVIENTPEELLEQVLLVECPRYLFPFARQVIANLTAEGGFPPFRMEPLDFLGIDMARQQYAAGNA